MVDSKDLWAGLGSALAVIVGVITMVMNQEMIRVYIHKIMAFLNPYKQITIHEYKDEGIERSEFFVAIEAYLSKYYSKKVNILEAELSRDKRSAEVSIGDEQQIQETLKDGSGATVRWHALTVYTSSQVIITRPGDEKRRLYRVSFHKRFYDHVVDKYLPGIFEEGCKIIAENRQLRLFTNRPSRMRRGETEVTMTCWSHLVFKHPATFDILAMDPMEKKAIKDDLKAFKEGKEYYAKIGKPWKRGYLLFGPPGTGKSTMVAAMANELKYDIYDLELTAVENNSMLRSLFMETKGKSIIVIEDIDRTVNITTSRDTKDDHGAKLTLSGMLNFIDGLWSACGGERIIIFTTNNKDKLDPALIRQGRMDKHIEMSYCRYEAFKVLANNYLHIQEDHFFELFCEIQQLLEEVDMSPAYVAEHLLRERNDTDACLKGLVVDLKKNAKDKAKAKEQVVDIISMEKPEAVEAK